MHLFLIHFFRSVWELSACSNLAWDQAIIVPCSPLFTWIRLSIPWVHQKDKLQLFCSSGVSVPNAVIYVPCVCFVLNCFPRLEIIIFILTTFTPSFWVVDDTLIIPVICFFFLEIIGLFALPIENSISGFLCVSFYIHCIICLKGRY